MSAPLLRPASTVVLLRQAPAGIEVFLVRRHRDIAFMGGAHVFPGGRVEEGDCDARYRQVADGAGAAASRMDDVEPGLALGFHVAAVRETFEEAGILLARAAGGGMVELAGAGAAAIAAERTAVGTGGTMLLDLARSHQWRLAFDQLAYFAHWVTPPIETRRFDTRFFLASSPPHQHAAHDAAETTEGVWLRPADAIARCLRGEMALPPPTWTTLRWLETFEDTGTALEWARHKPTPRVEPGFIESGDTRIVTLPGDAAMPVVAGFEARETRFVLTAGRWIPVDA